MRRVRRGVNLRPHVSRERSGLVPPLQTGFKAIPRAPYQPRFFVYLITYTYLVLNAHKGYAIYVYVRV